jgi:hypothetical protein
MPNHNREVDDLDIILHDALWSDQNSAPDPACVFAELRARVVPEDMPARALASWLRATPAWSSPSMSATYWYLVPLSRGIR